MKRLVWLFLLVFLVSVVPALGGESEKQKWVECKSKYHFQADCLACHIPPSGELKLPDGLKRVGQTLYMTIKYMDFADTRGQFLAIQGMPINKIIIDLFSYGGSLFDAMAMVSLIQEQQVLGRIVEMRGRGIVASAGLLILLAGDRGHRYIDKYSLIMFHELQSLEWVKISTPSDKEEEARIYRLIQNKINAYIAARSKVSVVQLNDFTKKREFWVDASDAVKLGFADKIFNE